MASHAAAHPPVSAAALVCALTLGLLASVGCSGQPDNVRREGAKVLITDVPPGEGEGYGYARGLHTLLAQAGRPVSYERLMAWSGTAFILQADPQHRWQGTLDAGWWPLDWWGVLLAQPRLEQAVGVELKTLGSLAMKPSEVEAVDDWTAYSRRDVVPQIRTLVEQGRPVLAWYCDCGFVVTGADGAQDGPPLLGRCSRTKGEALDRCPDWPIGGIVVGKPVKVVDPAQADLEALRHAVALAHDRIPAADPTYAGRRLTGQKAYAAWAALLRDADEKTQDRHHASVKNNLRHGRTIAAAWLRDLASRHNGEAAAELTKAADAYAKVAEKAAQIQHKGLSRDMAARRAAAAQVEALAALDLEAIGHIEKALAALSDAPAGADR